MIGMVKDILINGNGGWVGAVTRLGLPVVLSLLLTTFLIFKVDSVLGQVQTQVTTNTNLISNAGVSMRSFREDNIVNQRILRRLALQTCRNTAKTPEQLALCDRAAEE